NRLNDSRLPKQATAAHFKLVDNAQARIRRYLGYIFSSLLKVVSGSRYIHRPWDARPAYEAATRSNTPISGLGLGAGSRNVPPRWPAAPQALRVAGSSERAFGGSMPPNYGSMGRCILLVTARTPVGPSGARFGLHRCGERTPRQTRDQTQRGTKPRGK